MIFPFIRQVAPNITNLEQRHEGHAEIRVSLSFYFRNFSNSSIKQNSPNVLLTTKKFMLLRLGAVDRN